VPDHESSRGFLSVAFQAWTEEPVAQPKFPKYTTQIMNLANQTAQGTRPKVVGQLSDLFTQCNPGTFDDWVEWYLKTKPSAIQDATAKVWAQVQSYRQAVGLIDEDLVRAWVTDLVLSKTYQGLSVQSAVLNAVGKALGRQVRASTSKEESKGIDGYVGDLAVSIKPESYKTMVLPEDIKAPIIYYKEDPGRLDIEFHSVLAALPKTGK
jgi:hypothetical protein